jgi:hypothetical protein
LSILLAELVENYRNYKQRPLLEQVVRVSNTMFSVFTFWNLLRRWIEINEFNVSIFLAVLVSLAVLSGVVFGLLLLMRFSVKGHLLLLPVTLFGFVLSNESQKVERVSFIVGFSFTSLLLVRMIISLANKINRLK